MFKIILSVLLLFTFTGCVSDPEPNEFTQLRNDMEKHRERMFIQSDADLKNRKVNRRDVVHLIDPDEELRKQQEAEKKRWLAVDIDADEAEDWKALNLSPKSAVRWKKTGLSYNTISVLIKEDVSPSEAISFMNKKYDKNPKIFAVFAEPLYRFEDYCKQVISANISSLPIINKKCDDYIRDIGQSSISGHLADEYKNSDLSLEYVSRLRQVDNQKMYIQKQMNKKYNESLVQNNKEVFALLFPMLESSPEKEEMFFISVNKLNLKETQRYKSHKYYEFWVNKEKNEEKARIAAINLQAALNEAKTKRLQKESYALEAQSYNKMVASECGEIVNSEPSTEEKVHIEGKIKHIVGKRGSNIFAFIIENEKDGKNYLVRDPNSKDRVDKDKKISWIVTTVGRVVSISIDEDGTASYNHYEDESKEYYPLLRFTSECKYFTKPLVIN